jgi:hypothetical protein
MLKKLYFVFNNRPLQNFLLRNDVSPAKRRSIWWTRWTPGTSGQRRPNTSALVAKHGRWIHILIMPGKNGEKCELKTCQLDLIDERRREGKVKRRLCPQYHNNKQERKVGLSSPPCSSPPQKRLTISILNNLASIAINPNHPFENTSIFVLFYYHQAKTTIRLLALLARLFKY